MTRGMGKEKVWRNVREACWPQKNTKYAGEATRQRIPGGRSYSGGSRRRMPWLVAERPGGALLQGVRHPQCCCVVCHSSFLIGHFSFQSRRAKRQRMTITHSKSPAPFRKGGLAETRRDAASTLAARMPLPRWAGSPYGVWLPPCCCWASIRARGRRRSMQKL